MHKSRFIRITDDGHTSIHDEFPLTQSRDIVVRLDCGDDGKAINADIVPFSGQRHEPTFTLRASDMLAASYVRHWADMADVLGVTNEKVISARSTANAMAAYPKKHIPD